MTNKGHGPTSSSRLRLRPNLCSSLHDNNGTPYYLIEDPAGGGFYRLGSREWRLACQLDGTKTLADAATSESQSVRGAMSPREAEFVGRFLLAEGLATLVTPNGNICRNSPMPTRAERRIKLNPFFMRIPLIYPDRLLAAALPRCRWLTSLPFLAVWLVVVIRGGSCIITQWQRFTDTALTYLAPQTWVYLWLVWFGLKVIHEFFHGLFCKKYGGDVGSAGVALILFSPIAYVDVTSAWRLRSKWQRIAISGAGIYVEILIAGVAAILWSRLETGTVSHICYSVVLMASLTTLLFNANPLMRFDGYYILSDLLEIQNLYGKGQQYVRSLLRRCFLGLPTDRPKEKKRAHRWMVNAYGIAAAIWRIVICASLLLLASTLFHGAGLIIALFGVVTWIAIPCLRVVRFLVEGQNQPAPSRVRFAVMTAITFAIACAVMWLPWPGGVSAPAVVAYAPEGIVRTATEGFVERVHVNSGQYVNSNQLLFTLHNDEVCTELADAKLAIRQSRIRARILHRDGALAAYQAELEKIGAMQKQQKHLRSRVDGLEVRSPMAGYVLAQRPRDVIGQFMEVGTHLMTVVDERQKEIQISIPEVYIDTFSRKVGVTPRVRVAGGLGKVRAGQLVKVEPRASVIVRHAALSARFGGPLTTKETRSDETKPNNGGPKFELTAPRYYGVVSLSARESSRLRAGQLGKVRMFDSSETLGRRSYLAVRTWIQRKLNQRVTADI